MDLLVFIGLGLILGVTVTVVSVSMELLIEWCLKKRRKRKQPITIEVDEVIVKSLEPGHVEITPVGEVEIKQRSKQVPTLEELVSQITTENRHEEVKW